MKTLKARLKVDVKPCYLIEGEDYELYVRALSMISKAANLQLEEFNKSVFDDDNFDMQTVLNTCEILPMASDKRLVIVKNITKFNENDRVLLEKYLKNPVKSTVLVILDFFDKFSAVKNLCEFVDARRFNRELLQSVVVNELAKHDKKISLEAVGTLIDYCNGYLTNIVNEIDKLVYFDSDPLITKKIVETVVNKNAEFSIFELTEALGKKQGDKVISLLSKLEKEAGIFGLITNHFRRLFFIAISDASDQELANLLGVKEYAIKKQREQVRSFSKMQLKKIFALLEKLDYDIKSGSMLTQNALYYLAFSIMYTV